MGSNPHHKHIYIMNYKNCKVYTTDKDNWQCFKPCRELSDFHCWALHKAFKVIGLRTMHGNDYWCWDGRNGLQQVYYKTDGCTIKETIVLAITDNGVLFVREYDENGKQTYQGRISLSMYNI